MTKTEAVSDELTNLFGEWLAAHATAEQIDSYNDFCERRIIPALSRRAANSAGRVEVKVGDTVRVLRARNFYGEEVPGKPFAVGETFVVGKVDEDDHMYPCPIVFPEGEVFDFWRADDLEVVLTHPSSPVSAEVTVTDEDIQLGLAWLGGSVRSADPARLKLAADKILAALNGKE